VVNSRIVAPFKTFSYALQSPPRGMEATYRFTRPTYRFCGDPIHSLLAASRQGLFGDGVGRILKAAEERNAELALDLQYGLRRGLHVRLGGRLGVRSVYLELTPAGLNHA
jgi:hypothetical protein